MLTLRRKDAEAAAWKQEELISPETPACAAVKAGAVPGLREGDQGRRRDDGTAELAVITPAEALDGLPMFNSKVALRRPFELGIFFSLFPNCLNEVESPHTIRKERGMSTIVDLYETFVKCGTAKKKARGAAGAAHLDQHLVTKENLLAKRLIERQRRLTAAPAGKDPRGAQQ